MVAICYYGMVNRDIQDAGLAGLRAFVGKAPATRTGILAYNGTEALKIGRGIFAVPLGLLLS